MNTCKVVSYLDVKTEHLGRPGCRGARARRLIWEEDGAKNFHARMIEILPSGMIPSHQHEYEHCAFVLEGKCMVICGEEKKIVEEGSAIFIPANVKHSWHNITKTITTFLLVDVF